MGYVKQEYIRQREELQDELERLEERYELLHSEDHPEPATEQEYTAWLRELREVETDLEICKLNLSSLDWD